ncbi:MAG: nucleoside hydrolase [Bifidobacteriaceae bacterium]|nr:nucleoside hydrolase [Bifidobacteriaceae bacterium]
MARATDRSGANPAPKNPVTQHSINEEVVMANAVPFIVDTDTAQDDCVAIMLGLLDPAADLRAITMVAGNVGFDRQIANAHMTLNAAGRLGTVPIYLGCSQPMLRPWESAEAVHGDGSGGATMDMAGVTTETEHAVDALVRITAGAPGEVSICTIGPLTNIATAVVKDRGFASRVKSLHIMGGSNNGRGNMSAAAEYNFYVDPDAAHIVFEAGFPDIHVVTWDPITLRDATAPRAEYDRLAGIPTPLGRFFKSVCDTTLAFNESVGVDGSTHPDSLTLATLLHPEFIRTEREYRVDVETASELTRGYAAMVWPELQGDVGVTPNAKVVEAADRDSFFALLEWVLRRPTVPNRPMGGLA